MSTFVATSAPTPMWYATRGSGYTALVLLTAAVVLGLLTSVRWKSLAWPRFLSQALHRNVSLFALAFLVVHIVTAVVDPFAGLGVRDALVPFATSYRPLWLGLGVVGVELFVAVLLTSLVRNRFSFEVWRAIHLLAYASWPVAVLHTLGTGTDSKELWALFLVIVCVGAVAGALIVRLGYGWPRLAVARALGIAATAAGVIALGAWTVSGPLQPGWAKAAGTPANLLASAPTSAAQPAAPLAANLNDSLTGTLQRSDASATVTLEDTSDSTLTLVVVANDDGSGTVTVTRSGVRICTGQANFSEFVSAPCGRVTVNLQLFSEGAGRVAGRMTTQASSR